MILPLKLNHSVFKLPKNNQVTFIFLNAKNSTTVGPEITIKPMMMLYPTVCSVIIIMYIYYLNSSFKQGSISGTSMASPQVCRLGATVLQLNPYLTPAQLQLKLTNLASNNVLYTTNSGIDYADNRSLLNAPNKLLYTPFNSSNVLSAS